MPDTLQTLLAQVSLPTEALTPLLRREAPSAEDLEALLLAAAIGPAGRALAGGPRNKFTTALTALKNLGGSGLRSALEGTGEFGGLSWWMYKKLFTVTWERRGAFLGRYSLEWNGPRDYTFIPDKDDPFRFVAKDGTETRPQRMKTDGGSVPRIAWAVPDLDPWTYLPAYLIHDWGFITHHCLPDASRTFEEVNQALAEGIYTMMMDGTVPADWRKVEVVYRSVSSSVGRGLWDRNWTAAQCDLTLGR